MNYPNSRGSWVFSSGGLSVRITADPSAAEILNNLAELFDGYVNDGSVSLAEAELTILYDPIATDHPIFSSEPVDLRRTNHPLTEKLFKKAMSFQGIPCFDYEGDLSIIGFLNGMLIFRPTGVAVCILFHRAREAHFLVGSLHRLLFVYLCLIMAAHDRFFIHGAAIQYEQKGYIFWGPSGAGKTTVAGFSDRRDVFSDDAPILFREKDDFFCAVSPFNQLDIIAGQTIAVNKKIRVCKSLFLHKSTELKIREKSRPDALAEIMPLQFHCFEFMDRERKRKAFHFSCDLCQRIPAYDLYFSKDKHFWKLVAENGQSAVAV